MPDDEPSGLEPAYLTLDQLPPIGGQSSVADEEKLVSVEQRAREVFPSTYAGLFIGPDGVYVGFTDDPTESLRSIRELTSIDLIFRPFLAEHTLRRLKESQKTISGDMSRWRDQGIVLSAVGVDIRANRVLVILADDTPSARVALESRYGSGILVFQEGRFYAA